MTLALEAAALLRTDRAATVGVRHEEKPSVQRHRQLGDVAEDTPSTLAKLRGEGHVGILRGVPRAREFSDYFLSPPEVLLVAGAGVAVVVVLCDDPVELVVDEDSAFVVPASFLLEP